MKERLCWVDNAKFIGIYLVVLGHLRLPNSFATQLIYSFHVPLFFFLSGLLFHFDANRKEHIKKAFSRLVVPYFLINAFFIMLHVTANAYKYANGGGICLFDIKSDIIGVLLGNGYGLPGATPVCAPTWFLPALFIIWVFLCLVSQSPKHHLLYVFLALIVSFVLFKINNNTLPSPIASVMCLPFFLAGKYLKNIIAYTACALKEKENCFLCLFLFVVAIGLSILNGRVECCRLNFGNSFFLFYVSAFAGIGATLLISILCGKVALKFVQVISNGTIFILGFHLFINTFFFTLLSRYTSYDYVPWMGPIVALLIIIICYPLINLISRYFPILLGKRRNVKVISK